MVGVTADFPTSQMSTTREHVLLPLAQYPGVSWDLVPVSDDFGNSAHVMLIARSAPGEQPKKVMTALENTVRELDPEFLPSSVVTGLWLRQNSTRDFLVQSAVSGGAGGVILLLAGLGIYGVIGLMVAARHDHFRRREARDAWRDFRNRSHNRAQSPQCRKHGHRTQRCGAPRLRRWRRGCRTCRGSRQPRACTPRRVGPADGGHAIAIETTVALSSI